MHNFTEFLVSVVVGFFSIKMSGKHSVRNSGRFFPTSHYKMKMVAFRTFLNFVHLYFILIPVLTELLVMRTGFHFDTLVFLLQGICKLVGNCRITFDNDNDLLLCILFFHTAVSVFFSTGLAFVSLLIFGI